VHASSVSLSDGMSTAQLFVRFTNTLKGKRRSS
jgi:hypothetical protein